MADLPLEKVSVEAERAMASALQLAIDAHQEYLGTEHVLIGVLGQDGCLGAVALQSLGVTREFVSARLKPTTGPVTATVVDAVATTRLHQALIRSMLRSADTSVIDSRVLVDAVIDGEGTGGLILGEAGVTPEKWQVATLALGPAPRETSLDAFSPAFSRLWTQRGASRLRTNRLEEARADYLLVLGSATSDLEVGIAANNVAWTELCIGDADRFPDALALAKRAAAKIPEGRHIRGTLAFALIENGRIEEGVDTLVLDSVQGDDDYGTAARACILGIGVARLGNRPYAEVLLNVAEQLEPPSGLPARVRKEISKVPSPEPAAPPSVSEDSVPAAVQSLRYHPKMNEYVLVLSAYRRVYPTQVAAAGAERLRCLMTKAVLPGKREWIELLLASLRSRGASLSAISLDRQVARTARCTVAIKEEDGDWGFEVATSDAAVMSLLTGLPVRVSQELWAKYSMTDPSLGWNVKRFFREIFMWPETPSPPRPREKSRDPDNSGSPQGGGRQ
jgi:hypothetical protein